MNEAPQRRSRADAWRSTAALILAAAVYFGVRKLVEGTPDTATRNADRLLRFEQAIGIEFEHSLQRLVLDHPVLVDWSNHFYVWLHWPFLIFALVLLFIRDRRAFQQLRDTLIASGAMGLVVFAVFPVSPPRFMPGFVGTVSQTERQHFVQYPASWSNRVASLPSFHAGWTLVAAILLATMFRSRIVKVIALLPGPLVALAVITTGNHYVIDVLVGVGLSLAVLAIVSRRAADQLVPAQVRPQPVLLHSAYRLRR